MEKRSLLVLLLSFVGACHAAPPAESPAEAATSGAEAASPGETRPFVWRVSGGERPSYLFGTIHVGVSLEQALPAHLAPHAVGADKLIVELDMDHVDPNAVGRYAQLGGGRPLDELLAPETFQALAAELSGVLPAPALSLVRPWLPMTILTMMRVEAVHGGEMPPPMDQALVERVRQTNNDVGLLNPAPVGVYFLESADEQLGTMSSISDEIMADAIREMIEERAETDEEIRRMLATYRAGDEDALLELLFDPADVAAKPEFYQRLFYQRNQAWLATLRPQLPEGGLFVAVGLGHLVGPEGLVSGLRAAGFTVERVEP